MIKLVLYYSSKHAINLLLLPIPISILVFNLYSIKPKTYEKKTEKPVYDAPQSVKKALNDLANKMKV